MKNPCPRVIFIRHGQTEWSKSGQYTSVTDLPLTDFGVLQMKSTGLHLIGNSPLQMIKPANLKYVISSPRRRAQQTRDLLLESLTEEEKGHIQCEIAEDLREWEYGDYEGLRTDEIIKLRKSRGLDADKSENDPWNIWRDGCENGETHSEVKQRLDRLIANIQARHKEALDKDEPCDIVIIGHGHILRCFAARWLGKEINRNPDFLLEAGGVGVLSYGHRNINEPALCLAGAFTVPVEEEGADV